MPISVKKNVAILVTVYNGEMYLESTLRSLVAQDYEGVSIIIVDDCSRDRSPEIIDMYLQEYGNLIRSYKHQKNLGATAALRTGFDNLRKNEEFVVTIGQDDLLPSGYITSAMRKSQSNRTSVIFSNLGIIDSNGRQHRRIMGAPKLDFLGKYQLAAVFSRNLINAPGAMIRVEHLEKNYLLSDYPYTHDMHLWMHLATKGKLRLFFNSNCLYRVHSSSISSNRNDSELHEEIHRSRLEFLSSNSFIDYSSNLKNRERCILFLLIRLMTHNERNCKHKLLWLKKLRESLSLHGKKIRDEKYCETFQPKRQVLVRNVREKASRFTLLPNYTSTILATFKLMLSVVLSLLYKRKYGGDQT
jgi:glycosyltransferase involved in cell wall biosynthesis